MASKERQNQLYPILLVNFIGTLGFSIVLPFLVFLVKDFGGNAIVYGILGAHLLGTHAEEVINIFALAIRLGLGAEVLKKGIYTYPTNSSDITYML